MVVLHRHISSSKLPTTPSSNNSLLLCSLSLLRRSSSLSNPNQQASCFLSKQGRTHSVNSRFNSLLAVSCKLSLQGYWCRRPPVRIPLGKVCSCHNLRECPVPLAFSSHSNNPKLSSRQAPRTPSHKETYLEPSLSLQTRSPPLLSLSLLAPTHSLGLVNLKAPTLSLTLARLFPWAVSHSRISPPRQIPSRPRSLLVTHPRWRRHWHSRYPQRRIQTSHHVLRLSLYRMALRWTFNR